MQQTGFTVEYGRQVIRREWRNTYGQLHRTTGPAMECWTVLRSGAHVLSEERWNLNGRLHRESRPAFREWHITVDGTRAMVREEWIRHGSGHRVGGPSYRRWTVDDGGTRTLAGERWRVDDQLHRVDGPAAGPYDCFWYDVVVRQEDLPWFRRGRACLVALAASSTGTNQSQLLGDCSSAVFPAWIRDVRVAMTGAHPLSTTPTSPTYRSVVGGSMLLCV